MKNLFLGLTFVITIFTSCSGGDDAAQVGDNENPTPPVAQAPLVKDVTVTPANGPANTTSYEYDGAYIKKIVYSPNVYEELFYNENDDILKINKYQNGQLSSYTNFAYEYDTMLATWKRYVLNSNNQVSAVYESALSWQLSNRYVISTSLENDFSSYETYVYELGGYGDITLKEHATGTIDSQYTYGNTFSPYHNIYDFNNLQKIYTIFSKYNMLTQQDYINGVYAGKNRFEYTYNEENYPVEKKVINVGNNALMETITYTYY